MTHYQLEPVKVTDDAEAREEIHRRLREAGLLITPKGPALKPGVESFRPLKASGTPLSEIVRENRQAR